jgi:hypothetical protein
MGGGRSGTSNAVLIRSLRTNINSAHGTLYSMLIGRREEIRGFRDYCKKNTVTQLRIDPCRSGTNLAIFEGALRTDVATSSIPAY